MKRPIEKALKYRILAVDPGTKIVGWAIMILEQTWPPAIVDSGTIKAKGASRPARLASIDFELRRLTKRIPTRGGRVEIAVEDGYVGFGMNRNPPAQLALAEARGVCIVAASGGRWPVSYYSPGEVKKSITGNGRSEKVMVMACVQRTFKLPGLPDPDQADAIAIGHCHANRLQSRLTGLR